MAGIAKPVPVVPVAHATSMELVCTTGELCAFVVLSSSHTHMTLSSQLDIFEVGYFRINNDRSITNEQCRIGSNLADSLAILLCQPCGIEAIDRFELRQSTVGIN